jgi:hypothetical protein
MSFGSKEDQNLHHDTHTIAEPCHACLLNLQAIPEKAIPEKKGKNSPLVLASPFSKVWRRLIFLLLSTKRRKK